MQLVIVIRADGMNRRIAKDAKVRPYGSFLRSIGMSLKSEDLVPSNPNLIEYATTIVQAYVGNNRASASEVAGLIKDVHTTLAGLTGSGSEATVTTQKPAVPVKKSITPDYVICLEDGKKLKMLKRYLRTRYGLTTDEYRTKWGLPADYPMVAPNYSTRRSEFAKKIGLGRKERTPKKRKRLSLGPQGRPLNKSINTGAFSLRPVSHYDATPPGHT